MERLTEKFGDLHFRIKGNNTLYQKNPSLKQKVGYALAKLFELEEAEENGLLLKLPYKIGDTVWLVGNRFVNDYEIRRFIIDDTGVDCVQVAKEIKGVDYWNNFYKGDFGKTVFLTREEAEEALKKAGGNIC